MTLVSHSTSFSASGIVTMSIMSVSYSISHLVSDSVTYPVTLSVTELLHHSLQWFTVTYSKILSVDYSGLGYSTNYYVRHL